MTLQDRERTRTKPNPRFLFPAEITKVSFFFYHLNFQIQTVPGNDSKFVLSSAKRYFVFD